MEYKKLRDMKKEYFSFKDGRNNIVVDSSAIVSAVAACDDIPGGTPSSVLSSLIAEKINCFLAWYPASWDMGYFSFEIENRKFYVDFLCNKTCLYNRDSGRQLYQFISVYGLRLSSFRPSAGWHDNADYSVIFGKWLSGFQYSNDVEISA